jgi:hypothetical protein
LCQKTPLLNKEGVLIPIVLFFPLKTIEWVFSKANQFFSRSLGSLKICFS